MLTAKGKGIGWNKELHPVSEQETPMKVSSLKRALTRKGYALRVQEEDPQWFDGQIPGKLLSAVNGEKEIPLGLEHELHKLKSIRSIRF